MGLELLTRADRCGGWNRETRRSRRGGISLGLVAACALALLVGCASAPEVKTGTALRMKAQLDRSCVSSALAKQQGVSGVKAGEPTSFRFTPPGEQRAYAFQVRQVEVGLGDAWILEITGTHDVPGANQVLFAHDLEQDVTVVQDAVARACGAQLLPR